MCTGKKAANTTYRYEGAHLYSRSPNCEKVTISEVGPRYNHATCQPERFQVGPVALQVVDSSNFLKYIFCGLGCRRGAMEAFPPPTPRGGQAY